MNSNILRMLPLLILLLLSIAIALGLFNRGKENEYDLVNLGKNLSDFELPSLGTDKKFSPKLFGGGKVLVVNVFASWCEPCAVEHPVLMQLAHTVNIYGIAWKDKPDDVIQYIKQRGNPFQQIGVDELGITTVPMAITGVPETYVLDKNGAIALHYKAPLTQDMIDNVLIPLIKTLNNRNAN